MNIAVITGSPNPNGSSNLLAGQFIKGAREAGNAVCIIDTAHINVRPCMGCMRCGYNGPCAQKDDMEKVRPQLLGADMLVFVTPLYYYDMTAQMKTLVDRLCALSGTLQTKHMKSALFSVAANTDLATFDVLVAHYRAFCRYLNLTDVGMILGAGCNSPQITARSQYVAMAYEFGRRLAPQAAK
ncbi:MAG: flavodoxin family protein [Clostridiales bacterium]|nr:flavodoxin family protein [Clostridiales bacterium]